MTVDATHRSTRDLISAREHPTLTDDGEAVVNEYVVVVEMALTGPTSKRFTSLRAARAFAEKRSEAWPAVV